MDAPIALGSRVPDSNAQPSTPPPGPGLAAQFEAVLFKEAFAPLSRAIGFYGDAVIAAASEAMLRNGFGANDPLAAALEPSRGTPAR